MKPSILPRGRFETLVLAVVLILELVLVPVLVLIILVLVLVLVLILIPVPAPVPVPVLEARMLVLSWVPTLSHLSCSVIYLKQDTPHKLRTPGARKLVCVLPYLFIRGVDTTAFARRSYGVKWCPKIGFVVLIFGAPLENRGFP